MPRRTTYAIRLAVEGGGQVKAELVSVGQSGEQSLKRIESAGDRASGGLICWSFASAPNMFPSGGRSPTAGGICGTRSSTAIVHRSIGPGCRFWRDLATNYPDAKVSSRRSVGRSSGHARRSRAAVDERRHSILLTFQKTGTAAWSSPSTLSRCAIGRYHWPT
jgi:hypothetical protein